MESRPWTPHANFRLIFANNPVRIPNILRPWALQTPSYRFRKAFLRDSIWKPTRSFPDEFQIGVDSNSLRFPYGNWPWAHQKKTIDFERNPCSIPKVMWPWALQTIALSFHLEIDHELSRSKIERNLKGMWREFEIILKGASREFEGTANGNRMIL